MDPGHPGDRIQGAVNPLDLRAWLSAVEALGELVDVEGADWNLELGAISELNVKQDGRPRCSSTRSPAIRTAFAC